MIEAMKMQNSMTAGKMGKVCPQVPTSLLQPVMGVGPPHLRHGWVS